MLLETWWDMFEVGLLWTLEHLWCQLGRQRQAGSLFRTFAGCQRRRWMERLWLGVDFYVETNKQQCRSSVEVWFVYESMWMNVNHEAHTRCATFINYQYIMKMWCHMISHHKMSQDAWRDLKYSKIDVCWFQALKLRWAHEIGTLCAGHVARWGHAQPTARTMSCFDNTSSGTMLRFHWWLLWDHVL